MSGPGEEDQDRELDARGPVRTAGAEPPGEPPEPQDPQKLQPLREDQRPDARLREDQRPDARPDPRPPRPRREQPAGERSAPDGEFATVLNYVSQSFHGPLNAPQAHFGIATDTGSAPGGRRRATGRIDAGEIDTLIGSYVPPDPFERAVAALAEDTVVVLVGPPGTGKRSGAVALLKEVADSATYVVLSPDNSLEQLAERTFEKGIGYVLLDRTSEGPAAAQTADFDWRRVRDQVRGHGAHLVVTTVHDPEGGPPEAVRHIGWSGPDLAAVLRLRLRTGGHEEEEVAAAAALMPAECTVAEVAAAAGRILAGAEPALVWREYGSDAARPVRDWFTGTDRSLQEIAEITTLAFVTGAGRRTFESLQELLEPRLVSAFPPEPPPPAAPGAAPGTAPGEATSPPPPAAEPPLPAHRFADRRRSLRRNALVATEEQVQEQGSPTRTVVVFPSPQYRLWVLQELWANHSTAYWDGVREWLGQVVAAGPGQGLQMSVASGLALLAHPAFDEVADCYLLPWARGEAGPAGRSMAVQVLSWMALDTGLGAAALTLVRSWAQSGDRELRTTALLAFSGLLGMTFPTDAVKWLWHLISQWQGAPLSTEPMLALAQLFALLTEYEEDVRVVLDALVYRLRKQARTHVATHLKVVTFGTVGLVLAAVDQRTRAPAVAVLAGRGSPALRSVAELWTGVLCHRPFRSAALASLYTALCALPAVCEDPRAAAGRLGREMGALLPPDERSRLDLVLRRVAGRPRPQVAEIVDGFLAAVQRSENEGLRRHG
ncbi:hypothetical protein [Streptomyces sp. NPDC051211]|uniref:hypothetical protein n=1 Tax=Streptomyces sp. NPDC051211 TaxID=3154643 RepID=UPI00344CCD51